MMKRTIITGIVKKNIGRGTELGFPTANINIAEDELEDGIYLGLASWNGEKFPSVVFIGAAETFHESERKMEVYILDFSQDLYEKVLEVELLQKIRNSQKFSTKDELVLQMKEDERVAREFFANV